MTFASSGEDDIIAAYFDQVVGLKTGRFLDIGAANGITLSNTHLFANRGWGGVCVDANAQELFNLVQLYWDNPSIEIIQGCIAKGAGPWPFWNSKSANISTSSKRMQDRGRERTGARMTWVAGITMQGIFDIFGYNFNLISLDLEDGTLDAMRELRMDKLTDVRVICVEYLRPDWYFGEDEAAAVKAWGAEHGFRVLLQNDENVVLCR